MLIQLTLQIWTIINTETEEATIGTAKRQLITDCNIIKKLMNTDIGWISSALS